VPRVAAPIARPRAASSSCRTPAQSSICARSAETALKCRSSACGMTRKYPTDFCIPLRTVPITQTKLNRPDRLRRNLLIFTDDFFLHRIIALIVYPSYDHRANVDVEPDIQQDGDTQP